MQMLNIVWYSCYLLSSNYNAYFTDFSSFYPDSMTHHTLASSSRFPVSAVKDESTDTSSRSSAPTASTTTRGKGLTDTDNAVAEVALRSGGRVTVHGDSICAELMSRGSVLFWRCRILKNGPTHSHICNSWHGVLIVCLLLCARLFV